MINKETEGYYVLFTFSCVGDFPAELDRVYNITEGVLRSQIIAK
jgi:small subunit ribosomal protein S6